MTEPTMTVMQKQRLRLGLTQQGLADECERRGVKAYDSQISKIERGLVEPYPKLRATLAEILGLDIDLKRAEVRQ